MTTLMLFLYDLLGICTSCSAMFSGVSMPLWSEIRVLLMTLPKSATEESGCASRWVPFSVFLFPLETSSYVDLSLLLALLVPADEPFATGESSSSFF